MLKPFLGIYFVGFLVSGALFFVGRQSKFKIPKFSVYGLALIYLLTFTLLSVLRNVHFHTNAYDLGLFMQVLQNGIEGKGLDAPLRGHHFFGDHVVPLLYLLLPLYRIFPQAVFLLFLQTLALSVTGILLYRYALLVLDETSARLIALSFFLNPVLQYANLFEFHPDLFALPFFLLVFFPFSSPLRFLYLLLAILCKETYALYLLPFALLFLVEGRKGLACVSFFFGIAYFFLALFYVIPHFHTGGLVYSYMFAEFGKTPKDQIVGLLLHPWWLLKALSFQKAALFAFLLAPFLFLPLFSYGLFLALPTLLIHFLSNMILVQSPFYHHNAILLPFFYYGLIWKMKKQQLRSPSFLRGFFCFTLSFAFFFSPSPLSFSFLFSQYRLAPFRTRSFHWRTYFNAHPREQLYREALAVLSAEKKVCVPGEWIPHLPNPAQAKTFPLCKDEPIVAFDLKGNPYPVNRKWYQREAKKMLTQKNFEVLFSKDKVFVLRLRKKR